MSPDTCDVAAKALVDIRDTADLILLDFVEGRDASSAATRFAASQQYASRAMEYLEHISQDGRRSLPDQCVAYLRERFADRPTDEEKQTGVKRTGRPSRR